jgi:hypothetical protein
MYHNMILPDELHNSDYTPITFLMQGFQGNRPGILLLGIFIIKKPTLTGGNHRRFGVAHVQLRLQALLIPRASNIENDTHSQHGMDDYLQPENFQDEIAKCEELID